MAKATFHFPRGFLWGTATSAQQVEGNNTNSNWFSWENEPGRINRGDKFGLACDWWGGRWREDLDRAQETHQNAHRLSVEWSRVQPTPDRWDEAALDRYREMLRGLLERGLTPLVTLHHFSDPIWVAEMGGWENEKIIALFAKYVEKTVDALREYVTNWITINEPNVYASLAFLQGLFPPGKKEIGSFNHVIEIQVKAHAAAYRVIHTLQPQSRVGIAQMYRGFVPAKSWFALDQWAASFFSRNFNDVHPRAMTDGWLLQPFRRIHIPEAKNTLDFLGVNYYTKETVAFNILKWNDLFARHFYAPDAELSESGFIAHRPEGMFEALRWGLGFKVPMIITENGVDDRNDMLRPRYLIEHIHQIWRAVNLNYPVKGYFHWTLVDNFEWERGWSQRFGLWELDPVTQVRRKRPSADLYAQICGQNALSWETVSQYTPELLGKIFPG